MSKIYNIKPYQYIHILDKNLNKRTIVEGPCNYPIQENEEVVGDIIHNMIVISNLHQVLILNPVERDQEGKIVLNKFGSPKNKWGVYEVRTRDHWKKPFSLYPGEELIEKKEMLFVEKDSALHLRALLPFVDDDGVARKVGEEWLVRGPKYYIDRESEVSVVNIVYSHIIVKPNALRLKAKKNLTSSDGKSRIAGEEWLVTQEGSYLPDVYEAVLDNVQAVVLDDQTAVHLKANNNFVDIYNKKRHAGQEWIITNETAPYHVCGVYEDVIDIEKRVILDSNQYVVIENPFNKETQKNEYGKLKLVKGETSFFLQPGEIMRYIQKVFILTDSDALLLQALETFEDDEKNVKKCGEMWMIRGPCRYVPPVHVKVLEKRAVIPLDKNEGIYIRDKRTGEVKSHMGSSYLLQPHEVEWNKELPSLIEKIYLNDQSLSKREKSRVVTYKCPFNSVIQIYNLKEKSNRIVLGPNLAVLGPEEEFCLMSLSGSTPKIENKVQTLYLKLGPCFSTDEFLVETSDHTRLTLRIAYNWHFDIKNEEEAKKIFSVRDFIGDLCSTMASKIRSYIATITFEDFHKNSDLFIKKSVFGEKEGVIQNSIRFDVCNLVVTDVDIKSVIPTDPSTKSLLQKSVSLAIELATKTIEQEYNIQAKIKDQEFKGEVNKLEINNRIAYLKKEIVLNKLKVESEIIEKTGLSRAQASAKKDADLIESKAEVDYVKKLKESSEIMNEFELNKTKKTYDNEYLLFSERQRLELKEQKARTLVETEKFLKIIESIGPETIVEISKAGPELQARLLKGLNLEGYIVTDGNNPINLFNIASGMTKNNE